MKTLALFSLLAVCAAACAEDPSTPSDHMKVYQACLETRCDANQQSGTSACQACMSACSSASYDCDFTTACSASCSPRECSDYDESDCLEQGFKVVLPDNPSAEVLAACNRELARVADCGYSTSSTAADCARYAAVELPERAANYDCVAQLDCSSLTDHGALASCDPPASAFGDELCASLAAACPSNGCSSDRQALLDAEGAWVRPDALDAARTCLSQATCSDMADCLGHWVSAVE